MNKCKSFRKMLKSKASKTDPFGTPGISSKKVLQIIWKDCFLFLRCFFVKTIGNKFRNWEIMGYAVKGFKKIE